LSENIIICAHFNKSPQLKTFFIYLRLPSATVILLHRNTDRELGLTRRRFTFSHRVKKKKTPRNDSFGRAIHRFQHFLGTSYCAELLIVRHRIRFIIFIAIVINSFIKVSHNNKKSKHSKALKRKIKTQNTRENTNVTIITITTATNDWCTM
jgi:hypothetical protein